MIWYKNDKKHIQVSNQEYLCNIKNKKLKCLSQELFIFEDFSNKALKFFI